MMPIAKYRYFTFILHVLFWSIVLFFPYFISSADNRYKIGPLPGFYFTLSGIVHMLMFYVNTQFLYPKFLNKTYWWVYLISIVLLLILSVLLKQYILAWWFPGDLPGAGSHLLFPSAMAITISIFYSITVEKFHAEKLLKENEAIRLRMELKFLRSQVSPHFLFNVLTNFVSLARKKSEHLETSLLMLSDLMRYMLYDADKKISLQQEVEYLQSYIALQKLRFGRDVKILFNVAIAQAEKDHCIEPMLLIPFVENAFKHGIDLTDEPFIDINLTAEGTELTFRVTNKFEPEANTGKDETSGIGLNNVSARLALLYPDRHNLFIHTNNNLFNIHLTLKLL